MKFCILSQSFKWNISNYTLIFQSTGKAPVPKNKHATPLFCDKLISQSKFHTKSFVPQELFVRNMTSITFIFFPESTFHPSKVMFLWWFFQRHKWFCVKLVLEVAFLDLWQPPKCANQTTGYRGYAFKHPPKSTTVKRQVAWVCIFRGGV